jgi:hypothetical protein
LRWLFVAHIILHRYLTTPYFSLLIESMKSILRTVLYLSSIAAIIISFALSTQYYLHNQKELPIVRNRNIDVLVSHEWIADIVEQLTDEKVDVTYLIDNNNIETYSKNRESLRVDLYILDGVETRTPSINTIRSNRLDINPDRLTQPQIDPLYVRQVINEISKFLVTHGFNETVINTNTNTLRQKLQALYDKYFTLNTCANKKIVVTSDVFEMYNYQYNLELLSLADTNNIAAIDQLRISKKAIQTPSYPYNSNIQDLIGAVEYVNVTLGSSPRMTIEQELDVNLQQLKSTLGCP